MEAKNWDVPFYVSSGEILESLNIKSFQLSFLFGYISPILAPL
jgi:hypothetical protein